MPQWTGSSLSGKYQATPSTLTDGTQTQLLTDDKGAVVLGTGANTVGTVNVAGTVPVSGTFWQANQPVSFTTPVTSFSSAALAANGVYTTPTFDTVNGQSYLSSSIHSATDLSLEFEESNDGTNWYGVSSHTIAANVGGYNMHKVSARYGRVVVTNGLTANPGGFPALSIACKLDTIGSESDVQLVDKFNTAITADRSWGLRVKTSQDTDAFGASVSHGRYSQLSANFSQALTYNDVTVTTTSSGTVTQANGSVTLATGGTVGAASATLQTNSVVSYQPGHELYAVFTAAFTTPTGNSNQRIGLFDTSNGFFIGYNGTAFGITWRQNGVDTFIAQTAFNEDTLIGNINSFFTTNFAPVAIDPTKKNIFRIRFGWLGVAPVKFEVLSPDGRWVRFHVIRYPNTAVAPHVYNPNLPITAEVSRTSGNANLQISSSSWNAGIVDSGESDLIYTGSISALNGALTSNCSHRGTLSVNVTGTWVGTLIVEGHNGDLQWVQLSGLSVTGVPVTSVTTNQFWYINSSAYTQVRVRASAWTSGTAVVQTNATQTTQSIFTQTVGNIAAGVADAGSPIKIGGVAKTVQPTAVTDGQRSNILTDKLGRVVVAPGHARELVVNQYTQLTSTTETTILTATAATFLDISSIVITNASNQNVNVTLRDSTGGTTRAVFNIAANGGLVFNPAIPFKQATVNNNWTMQLSATATVNVTVIAVQNV